VQAGFAVHWSSGPVEGNINRDKLIKHECVVERNSTCYANECCLFGTEPKGLMTADRGDGGARRQ
jgi:hypothetical protein